MSEDVPKYASRLRDLIEKKYKTVSSFSRVSEDGVSLRQLNNILNNDADAKVSSEEKIADDLSIPRFMLVAYAHGNIEMEDLINYQNNKPFTLTLNPNKKWIATPKTE